MKLSELHGDKNDVLDAIRRTIGNVEYIDDSDGQKLGGWSGARKAGVRVWWLPTKRKVFISTGDWADPKPWHQAIGKVVGEANVDGESESGPSGPGWVQIKEKST